MTLARAVTLGCVLVVGSCFVLPVRGVAQDADAEEPARDEPRREDVDDAPWQGATDATLPPFLQDTGKRVVDERPKPSEAQLEALRQLEEEVSRFSESGVKPATSANSTVTFLRSPSSEPRVVRIRSARCGGV